jgi:POT family proton-dependent oligopeptide transporter
MTKAKDWFKAPGMNSIQTQSINPFFIITLAPIFAWFWIWLHKRKLQPSTPTKMVFGLAMVAVAFGVMLPAAQREAGPSQSPLATLPGAFGVDEDGRIFTTDSEGEERIFYGATRLRYDAGEQVLLMSGVLPDLDRLKILSETAPAGFKKTIKTIVEKSKALKKGDELTEVLANPPAGFAMVGEEARKAAAWDSETNTLTVKQQIGARAEVELLATTADPAFKAAVDGIYVDSSKHRVTIWWLILFFMCLTMGELCLSPVGLSLVTKLAPPKHVGVFMGGWFLATAIAEFAANMFGAYWGKMVPWKYFLIFIVMCSAGALLMALLIRPMKRMMHGVH